MASAAACGSVSPFTRAVASRQNVPEPTSPGIWSEPSKPAGVPVVRTSRKPLPRNWSRTRTQAINVPIPTLSRVTSAAIPTVSRMAAAVCSLVMLAQKVLQPPSPAVTTTAERGMSTSRLRYSTVCPRVRPKPGSTLGCLRGKGISGEW